MMIDIKWQDNFIGSIQAYNKERGIDLSKELTIKTIENDRVLIAENDYTYTEVSASMDTIVREYVDDCIAQFFLKERWPMYKDGDEHFQNFHKRLMDSINGFESEKEMIDE